MTNVLHDLDGRQSVRQLHQGDAVRSPASSPAPVEAFQPWTLTMNCPDCGGILTPATQSARYSTRELRGLLRCIDNGHEQLVIVRLVRSVKEMSEKRAEYRHRARSDE